VTDASEIRRLYGDPALERLWVAVRDRLERRGRDARGWLTLAGPTSDERVAVSRLLGAARVVDAFDVRIALTDLEAELRRQALGLGLADVVEGLGGPLVPRLSAARAREAARSLVFDDTAAHPALARHPALASWLAGLRARGTLSRLEPIPARGLLQGALDVLTVLPGGPVSLTVLAGRVAGSTHALDRGSPLGVLVDRALAFLANAGPVAGRRELWARYGVTLDAVSSTTIALNLRTRGSRLDMLLGAAADAGEPVHVTLRMLRGLDALDTGGALVSVCENRSVIEAVADELGATAAPLVCTSGEPSAAGRRLVELLRIGGARLRYHGDFDPEGIGIANGVIGPGVEPWRFDADAYLAAAARTPLPDELGPGTTRARWDGRLAGALATVGARIYEEHVLDDLVADLRAPAVAPSIELIGGPADAPEAWVEASLTRNFVLGDPVCDWLRRHGEAAGFVPDDALPDYDPRTDFLHFVLEQGRAFEAGVIALLAQSAELRTISTDASDAASTDCAAATLDAMRAGTPLIAQGVLHDRELGAYGTADLLVRADVLEDLVPGTLEGGGASRAAPALGTPWHYRAVDLKFHRFELLRDGHASSDADSLPFLVQVWLYNRALGTTQGYRPPSGYLLGRGWTAGGERGTSCLERLARVDADRWLEHRGTSLELLARQALGWIRQLRADGASWTVLPEPNVPELYPNMRRGGDAPWHTAKRRIADEIGELTVLPRINPDMRRAAHVAGIRRWDEEGVNAERLGQTMPIYARQLDAVLDANRSLEPLLLPERFVNADPAWRDRAAAEFFVDFETVSDLDDDFSRLPETGGQPLIFQIGCGRLNSDGTWRFAQWTAERLDVASEAQIIAALLDHLRSVTAAVGVTLTEARLYHWSPAETSTLETAYNAARTRHLDEGWPSPDALQWCDLLARLARVEPLTVTGSFGFGLKPIAKAMAAQRFITTTWTDGPHDGLGAMVGAWRCDREARRLGVPMRQIPLMGEIGGYNEVDCRAMAEVLSWLRENR
jgi:uncharacterized protein (TIGR02679 family)